MLGNVHRRTTENVLALDQKSAIICNVCNFMRTHVFGIENKVLQKVILYFLLTENGFGIN